MMNAVLKYALVALVVCLVGCAGPDGPQEADGWGAGAVEVVEYHESGRIEKVWLVEPGTLVIDRGTLEAVFLDAVTGQRVVVESYRVRY